MPDDPDDKKRKAPRGAKRSVRLDGARLRKTREAAEMTQEELALSAGLSTDGIRRTERSVKISYETATSICAALGVNVDDYIIPTDDTITLIPIPSDSRIITGDMIVLGGNYIDGSPFAFEASLTIRAATDGDIVKFDCYLFREKNMPIFPPGKSIDDYNIIEMDSLPREISRKYAVNQTPARLGGAYGIFSVGNRVSPLRVSNPMIVIDGQDVPLRDDFVTLVKPYRLEAGKPVIVRYGRVCLPGDTDEAPADYIYRATIECKIGFLSPNSRSVKEISWVLDYSEGGTLSLRP